MDPKITEAEMADHTGKAFGSHLLLKFSKWVLPETLQDTGPQTPGQAGNSECRRLRKGPDAGKQWKAPSKRWLHCWKQVKTPNGVPLFYR